MGSLRSGVGLVSGIDTAQVVQQLIALKQKPIVRLQDRTSALQKQNVAVKTLEANLLSMATALQSLGNKSNYSKFTVRNSDPTQLTATANSDATPGTYEFQTLQLASTYQALSRGFADADEQAVGTGTITIQTGGHLRAPTRLDSLNGGNGVRRGVIRITDRTGNSADVDLSNAFTVDDVLAAINDANGISVSASTLGGRIVLSDTSGSTANDLSVVDLGNGQAAVDLGINKSVSDATLNGDDVLVLSGDFTLDQINDGNQLRRLTGAPDIKLTAADGTEIEVNLDDAFSLNDVIAAINDHEDNAGKITAELSDGRLILTDNTTGASMFQIEDINGTNVIDALGLDAAAAGNTITGAKLLAGIDSVLLRNLRGGQGIDTIGQLSLTDRTGATATVDLSGAESLDEVLAAVNSAEDGGTKLQLTARINDTGTGIEVIDTSGATASNLIVADVGGSTLAAQLGIEVDAAQDSVNSGSLNLRYLNENSSIEKYTASGGAVSPGQIRITDSAGNVDTIAISGAVKSIGDVLQRINASSILQVTAELNETGDGFVLIDEAGGAGTLSVEDVDADTAADLRILGDGVAGIDGKQRISSRFAAVIDVEAGDTLNDVVSKINTAAGFVTANVFDDSSAFNSKRLLFTSATDGFAGRLIIDDSGLDLGMTTTSVGQDALLRLGATSGGFVISSPNGHFEDAVTGIDVDVLSVGSTPAQITVSRDDSKIASSLQAFVDAYNSFSKAAAEQTKFDPETLERGTLQGSGLVLRAQSRLRALAVRQFNGFGEFNSLVDLGIRARSDGTLEFDRNKLDAAIQTDRDAVDDFVLRDEDGFADVADALLKSLTDPADGAFALESNALQSSIDSLNDRIQTLDDALQLEQQRLLIQFAQMENALSSLTAQQQSISAIQPLSVNPIGKGIY